ncbi:MAG: precorrin-6Y C5,15-methyltransferase (decarboxylating) subunit CbiT [Pseudomonadota bacterium]
MTDGPWLSLIGMAEDGLEGLTPASRQTLEAAEVIIGTQRLLNHVGSVSAEKVTWPVPFEDGWPVLRSFAGRPTALLLSGDPFWFGAGAGVAERFEPGEWQSFPAPSTFSLIASQLGWALERCVCLGLHAAPLRRLRPHLAPRARLIVLLRDGDAVVGLAEYLTARGFGDSALHVCEALGSEGARVTRVLAKDAGAGFTHPVAVGVEVHGDGTALPQTSGLPDDLFESDGQMTKRVIRAATLSALAPHPFETLWDIGGGTGTIAIEWLLSHPTTHAVAVEPRHDRAERIARNAKSFGVDRLTVVQGAAPEALERLPTPDAVFIGGGLSEEMLRALTAALTPGTRLVANAVTLESEALVTQWQSARGGSLIRLTLEEASPLGSKRGWKASYPVTQWSVTL